MSRTSPRRTLLASLGLAAAATLLALLGGELVVRLLFPPPPRLVVQPTGEGMADVELEEDYLMAFENDPELFWRLAPNVSLPDADALLRGVVSNAAGLRTERAIPLEKPPREIRILFLGDSVTFGWRLPHDQAFPYLVEQRLRARFPELDITCINAGVPGYTLFQGWRFLVTRGLRYEPDLVVLAFGFNETGHWISGRGDFEEYQDWQAKQPPAWLQRSQLARRLWTLNAADTAPTDESRERITPAEFRELLERVETATSAEGADLLLLVPGLQLNVDGTRPASYRRPLQLELYRFGRAHRFGPAGAPALVDGVRPLQELAETHASEEIFFDHVHPTRLANERLADALAEAIAPWLQTRIRY